MICLFFLSCKTSAENKIQYNTETSEQQYSVYIMNSGMHTGLIIPVNRISADEISAVELFADYKFIDFGWGDEDYYQTPGANCCLGLKAVALPTSSVVRAQGFSNTPEDVALWTDYTVKFMLTSSDFSKLCDYIDKSFRRDEQNKLMETLRKRNGEIIFFKSVYYYHAFNTCNTWVARGLKSSGIELTTFMVITAGDLFDEIRDKGLILKRK